MSKNWMFLVWVSGVYAGVVHEKRTYERREVVEGIPFAYQSIIDDGQASDFYFVADQAVDRETYQQHMQQSQELYVQAVARQVNSVPIDKEIKVHAVLKILTLLHDAIEKQLVRLSDEQVSPFLVFKPSTIDDRQSLERIKLQLLPALAFVREPEAAHESVAVLTALSDNVQRVYDRLVQLYTDSLESVLARSDDPKTLRQLLETINH